MKYQFRAVYDDGSIVDQHADQEDERSFKDIDQKRLIEFMLLGDNKRFSVNVRTGEFNLDGLPVRFAWLPDGKKELVYFRRVRVDAMPDMLLTTTQFAIGLAVEKPGETFQAIVLVDEYGKVQILNHK